MAKSHGERLLKIKLRRAAAIVPVAMAIAAPILSALPALPAQAETQAKQHVTPLKLIMNPAHSKPVGTECTTALLFGLKKKTLIARIFCAETTGKNIDAWGYQFDSKKDYLVGVRHINSYTGFSSLPAGHACPPPHGSKAGKADWHAKSNPKYKARPGQFVECFLDNGKPVLIWTMPTQHVFFIAQYHLAGGTIRKTIKWWRTLSYG